MPASAYHHLALRVADLGSSTRFYEAVFGGEVAFSMDLPAEFLEQMLRSPADTSGRLNWLTFDGAGSLELWEFTPNRPVPDEPQTEVGVMHFGLTVDDVSAAVQRVVENGGRALIPIRPWHNGRSVTFVADPDGHVIELLDATVDETVRIISGGGGPPDHRRVVDG